MSDIDIVVLWVDGSDPAWLEEKQKYSEKIFIYAGKEECISDF